MGDAPGQGAQGLELLRLPELRFQAAAQLLGAEPIRDVAGVHQDPRVGPPFEVEPADHLQGPPFAALGLHAEERGLRLAVRAQRLFQQLAYRGLVLRVGELERAPRDHLGGGVAENTLHRGAREPHPTIGFEHPHEVQGAFHQRAVLLLALPEGLLRPPTLHDVSPLPQRPRGHVRHLGEGEVRLHHVVEGTQAHGLDRHLLVAEGGHDHHRAGGALAKHAHQLGPVPVGQAQIGDHQIGLDLLHGEQGLA